MAIQPRRRPAFENRIVHTRKVYKEYFYATTRIRMLKCLCLLVFCALAASVVITGVAADFKGEGFWTLVIFAGFLALFYFLLSSVFIPIIISSAHKKFCESAGEDRTDSLLFYSDGLLIIQKGAETVYEYAAFAKIRECRNLCILLIGNPKNKLKKAALIVSKDGFTVGDYKNFKEFIALKTNLPVK